MADHHDRGALLDQVALQPLDRLDIQVVGRFVEQQEVRFLQQDFAQGDAHLPAARIIGHELLGSLGTEADRGEQLVDAGVEFVAVQGLKTAVQTPQFVDQLIQVLRVCCGLLTGHGVFDLVLAYQHLGRFAEGLEQLLAHGAAGVHIKLLLQIGDPGLALLDHQASAGLFQARNDLHLG